MGFAAFLIICGIFALLWLIWGAPRSDWEWLREFSESGRKIVVGPSGHIKGVTTDESPEEYVDEERGGVKRSRFVYKDLNGETRREEKHGFPKKTGRRTDLVPIEAPGGIALTQLANPSGKVEPIIVGATAESLRAEMEDTEVLESRIRELQEEKERKDQNYRDLQDQIDSFRKERDELRKDVREKRKTLKQLRDENERLDTRVIGAESRARMLEDEFQHLKNRYDIAQEDIDQILEDARERERKAVDLGVTGVPAEEEEVEA